MKVSIQRAAVLGLTAISLFIAGSLFAGGNSATWQTNPGTGDWNAAANWNPMVVPNGNSDAAFFGSSSETSIAISANTTVHNATFNAGASAFTLTATSSLTFTFNSTGILNNSGVVQNFVTNVNSGSFFGTFVFQNGATTTSLTEFTNKGATQNGATGGSTQFLDNSNAGLAVFIDYTNKGGAAAGANGGSTSFFDMSSAGNAAFINEGGTVDGAFGGRTNFNDQATAASGTFSNNAGGSTSNFGGGATIFHDTSTAATGFFFNNGAAAAGSDAGFTEFDDMSDAGSSMITNNAGAALGARGGAVVFLGMSSAAGSTIINNGATTAGSGGNAQFTGFATAGSANIMNLGSDAAAAQGGFTEFVTSSDAGMATIENGSATAAAGEGGSTAFEQNASAANSSITNDGSAFNGSNTPGRTVFEGSPPTAGNSTITNNAGTAAGAKGGLTSFQDGSLGGSATIHNLGATVAGANGGATTFENASDAENAQITSDGGLAGGAGAGLTSFGGSSHASNATVTANGGTGAAVFGALTVFISNSHADAAILIANGGTSGGAGGLISFEDLSDGGTSQVRLFGNGALSITHNVTIGSLLGDPASNVLLASNTLTVGSNDLSTEFDGVISGSGGLTKIGTGTLILGNDSTYGGGTTISAGAIAVGSLNALGMGNVTVDGGTLQSFNGPRAIGVGGNYVQTGAGTLRLLIGGTDSGSESDFLTVNGTISLDGTLQLVRANNFHPANGDRVNIIGGPNGHSGEFSNVTSDFVGVLQPMVFYDDPLDVYILFELTSFVLPGLTPNQLAVAHKLNQIANDPAASDLIDFVSGEPPENLAHDYDLIAPEELASIYEVSFSHSIVQNMNLQHRMDDIRAGVTGFCGTAWQPHETGKNVASDKNVVAPSGTVLQSAPDYHWGSFASGSGEFINVDGDFNAHGYDITTGSFIAGVDYRFGDHFAIGIDGGYNHSDADLVDHGRLDVDGARAGAYATAYGFKILGSNVHVDGAVGGGWNDYDTRRTGLDEVIKMTYNDTARGSTDGSEFNAMLSYGADWVFGCLDIGTWSTIQYIDVDIDGFTESGSLAPLHIEGHDEDSLIGTTGVRLAYDWHCGSMLVRPEVRAAWMHESNDRSYAISSHFASGAGDTFTVHGPKIGRDSALVDAGVAFQWSSRFSGFLYYDGVLGRDNYNNNSVSGGLRISF